MNVVKVILLVTTVSIANKQIYCHEKRSDLLSYLHTQQIHHLELQHCDYRADSKVDICRKDFCGFKIFSHGRGRSGMLLSIFNKFQRDPVCCKEVPKSLQEKKFDIINFDDDVLS